jgi:hypothetical protein
VSKLNDFNVINRYVRPPEYQGTYNRHITAGEDEARYILMPDAEFDRPWIASPQGSSGPAFVWPLGVEGFSFSSNATAGIHHYIGDNDVYVDIVYPDEYHLVLNGVFPGNTSPQLMSLLRQVILHQPDPPGIKLLSIAPAAALIQRVRVINHSFTRDAGDTYTRINYSIECIRTGTGSAALSTIDAIPDPDPSNSQLRGSALGRHTVKSIQDFPGLASLLYKSNGLPAQMQLWSLNEAKMESLSIPLFKIPYALIPVGTVINY